MKNKKYCKVRNHCHYTGEYRGAAHSICNIKYNVPKNIPIVFHKGSSYDHHFIIKELAVYLSVYLFRTKYWKIYKPLHFQ